MNIADVCKRKATKYNNYQNQGFDNPENSCKTCIRKTFSYPYTCNDGWPMGGSNWVDRGKSCLNWTDQRDAQVD